MPGIDCKQAQLSHREPHCVPSTVLAPVDTLFGSWCTFDQTSWILGIGQNGLTFCGVAGPHTCPVCFSSIPGLGMVNQKRLNLRTGASGLVGSKWGRWGLVDLMLLVLKHCCWARFSPRPSLQVYWSNWDGVGLGFHWREPLAELQTPRLSLCDSF